jgi:cytoskeletal protein CcmA (bactofilin family)
MFNSRSKASFDESSISANTIIGAGTTITGDMESNGDIRIDGVLKGNLNAKAKILIGPDGMVEGDIEGQQADVLGKVTGKIKVKELLHLRGKATIHGDIYAGKLQIEPTVTFNGQCHMGANIVELNSDRANAVNQ